MSEGISGGSSAPAAAESSAPVSSDVNTSASSAQASGEISSAEGIEEALEAGDISEKEAQKLIKKFDLKIRGKTVSKEYDLSDDAFLKNQFQLAEVAKQEMQSSAELKKAYQKEMERFKTNPWEVLKELGFDPDELAQSRLEQRIEEMKKSPEQLEQEQLRAELKLAREEAKKNKDERDEIEMQKLQEQASIQINDEIGAAIANHKTLPNSKYVQKRVADSMLWAMNNGYEDVTAEDVMDIVEQEMRSEMGQLYDEMPEELLEQFIGKKNIDRMRKKRISAVKVQSVSDIKQTTLSSQATALNKKKESLNPVAARDFFKKLGKK